MSKECKFSKEFKNGLAKLNTSDMDYHGTPMFACRLETSHTCPGLNDWFITRNNRTYLVELKVDGRSMTPAQVVVRTLLQRSNTTYFLLDKKTESRYILKYEDKVHEFNNLDEAIVAIMEHH